MSRALNLQTLEKNSFIKPYSLRQKTALQRNVDKSLIADLPESMDLSQKLRQKDMEIQRLSHALDFYRNNDKTTQKSINPFDFYLNSDKKPAPSTNHNIKFEEYLFESQIKQLIESAGKGHEYKIQNGALKEEVRELREQLMELQEMRRSGSWSEKEINKKVKDSQIEVNILKSEIWSLEAEIGRLNYENSELKKALNSITKIKLGEQSESVLKVIQHSSQVHSVSSNVQNKLSELKYNLESKTNECELLKQKNTELETRLYKINEEQSSSIRDYSNNLSPSKKRSPSYSLSSQKKVNIINSINEFQMIDAERYQLKINQKNKEYEQLYSKYQKVQSQKIALQDLNEELERERKFLADRLNEIEILQEGDEVVGEMENKLVLMSTELMRLGNLNRNKLKETQELSLKLKETIHKLEVSTKQNIEKDKIILNYKEQLTLIEQKIHEKHMLDDYDQETLEEYKEQLIQKDKQISRVKYLNKQLQEELKTLELKIKVFEEKIMRLESDNRELEKELKDMEKSVMNQSSVKHFNLELEIDRYKNQCETLNQEIKSLQQKLSTQRNLLHEVQSQKTSLISQRQTYDDRMNQLELKIKKYEFRMEQKEQELRDLKHGYEEKIITKNDEIRKITEKITIMEKNAESLMKSQKNIGLNESTLENMHRVEEQNMVLRIELSKYEERATKLSLELQRVNISLDRLSQQNQSLASVNSTFKDKDKELRDYKRQVEALNNRIKRAQDEKHFIEVRSEETLRELKQLQSIQGEYRRLKNEYEMAAHQLEIKQEQVNSLTKRLEGGNNSILSPRSYVNEETQRQISSYEKKLSTLTSEHNQEIYKYSTELSALKRQLETCKMKLASLEHIQSQDNLHEQLSDQIIRLNNVLGQRIGEIVTLQKELELSQHKVAKCEELLANQRHSKIKEVNSFISQNSIVDNQPSASHLKSQEKDILLLTQRLKSTKESHRLLQEKYDQLISEKIKLQHRVSELEYMKGERSMVYHQNETHLTNLITDIRISNERLEQSLKQIQQHYIEKLEEKNIDLKRVENSYREEKSTLERQLYELQSDNRRLQAQCREKESLLMRNEKSTVMHESEHQNVLKIKEEYEIKLVLLSQQLERYKLVKDEKTEELNLLKSKYSKMEEEKKEVIIENQSNKNTIEIFSQEIQRLSVVLSNNIDEIRHSDRVIAKLNQKIQELNGEIKSLREMNFNSNRLIEPLSPGRRSATVPEQEYETLNQQYITCKNSLLSTEQQLIHTQQQLKDYQHKLQTIKNQNLQLQQQYSRVVREKRAMTEEKDTLESRVREVKRNEEHLKELLNEELRKKQQNEMELFQKQSQIQQYKAKDREESSLNILREEIRLLKDSNNILQSKFELILTENQKLVYQVQTFKRAKSNSITSTKNQQNQQANKAQQLQEMAHLKAQNQLLRKQIHQLEQKIIENNKYRGQIQSFQEQSHEFENRMKRMSVEKSQLLDELGKIQQEFKEKCQQVRKINQRNNELEDEIHNLKTKGERANQEVIVLKKDKKQLIEKMQLLQRTYISNQQNANQNNSNPNNLNPNMNSSRIKAEYYTKTIKMTSIDEVAEQEERSRGPSAHQNKHNQENQGSPGGSQNISKEWMQRYELLEGINSKLKKQNECFRKKSIEYEFKMNKLKEEFDLLSKLINEYRDENDKLKKVLNQNQQITTQGRDNYVITSHKNLALGGHDAMNSNIKSPLTVSNQTVATSNMHTRQMSNHYNHSLSSITSKGNIPQSDKNAIQSSSNINLNLNATKNGSSVTFRAMNLNEYNELKESMHHIQAQISQKSIASNNHLNNNAHHLIGSHGLNNNMSILLNSDSSNATVTLPIEQIHMLINEIDRLLQENKNLSQQLSDHKVILIKHESAKARYEENLATIVIMVIQIEALRHRVAVAQAEREQFRRQSFSPTNSNR